MEGQTAFLGDEAAPRLPAGQLRDEVRRRDQLDVQLQLFLEVGRATQERVGLGLEHEIMSMVDSRQPSSTALAPPVR